MRELFYRKQKDGSYRVTDRDGNSAEGATKEMAENQYYLLYKMVKPSAYTPNLYDIRNKLINNQK